MNAELRDDLAELTAAHNACVRKLGARNRELEARVAALEDLVNQMALALGLEPIETEGHLAKAA